MCMNMNTMPLLFHQIPLPRSTNPGLYSSTRISIREGPVPKVVKHHDTTEDGEVGEGGCVMPHQLEITSSGNLKEDGETRLCLGTEVELQRHSNDNC